MPSERERLIGAVRETPDDDAPRLVMADWFAEQGGPENEARADFIRTQIDRARLPDDDERQSELQARELRLLKRWGAEWQGSHFGFRKSVFRRGFIEYAHLHLTHFLHHRRQLMALEPLRDIRLTGWHRAEPNMVRRVAACEELRHVETLRIHHQGPHKDPDGRVLPLLESPHLTGLKRFDGTRFTFTADERRRFERLPLLGSVERIIWPDLDQYPHSPGEWFQDDGAGSVTGLTRIRSLALPHYMSPTLLRMFMSLSFWDGLESLTLSVSGSEDTDLLGGGLPSALRELRVSGRSVPLFGPIPRSFWEVLARAPLRSVRLTYIDITPRALEAALGPDGRWDLEELEIVGGHIGRPHAEAVAGSRGARRLRRLNLSDHTFGLEAHRALLQGNLCEQLGTLALYLQDGDSAVLDDLPPLPALRHLRLTGPGVTTTGLERLIERPNLRALVGLSATHLPTLSVDLLRALGHLPHLARLSLYARERPRGVRPMLGRLDRSAWLSVSTNQDSDSIEEYRASRAPERTPPLDGWEEWWPE